MVMVVVVVLFGDVVCYQMLVRNVSISLITKELTNSGLAGE